MSIFKSIKLEISDEPQDYLVSEELTLEEKKLLFKLRSRMTDIKSNFKSMYKDDLLCQLCQCEEETSKHLLECKTVLDDENIGDAARKVKNADIFKDINKQVKAVKVWKEILKLREKKTSTK